MGRDLLKPLEMKIKTSRVVIEELVIPTYRHRSFNTDSLATRKDVYIKLFQEDDETLTLCTATLTQTSAEVEFNYNYSVNSSAANYLLGKVLGRASHKSSPEVFDRAVKDARALMLGRHWRSRLSEAA